MYLHILGVLGWLETRGGGGGKDAYLTIGDGAEGVDEVGWIGKVIEYGERVWYEGLCVCVCVCKRACGRV